MNNRNLVSATPRAAQTRTAQARTASERATPMSLAPRASTRNAKRTRETAPAAASSEEIDLKRFAWLCAASFAFWSLVSRLPSFAGIATYGLAGVLSFHVFFFMIRGKAVPALALLAYMAAVQPPMRQFAPALPYLLLNYLMIVSALVLFLESRRPMTLALPFLLYGFYVLLEVAGMISNDMFVYGRAVLVPSITILVYVALAFKLRLSRSDVRSLFCAYMAGALGTATIILTRFQTGQLINWGTESNSSASGGMGGNQITLLLAVGAFMAFVSADELKGLKKLPLLLLAGVLAYFMVLTFSRGGLYMLGAVSAIYYLVLKKPNVKTLIALLFFGLAGFIVFNLTMETTGGRILARYSETTLTNRDRIVAGGWQIFLDNMAFGVGTGNFYGAIEGVNGLGTTGAHNELIRAAAEHGVFGLASWVLFAVASLCYAAFGAGAGDRNQRALRVAFFLFVMLSMFYNGLKLLVQPFLLLLALCAFSTEYEAMRAARREQKRRKNQLQLAKVRRAREARKLRLPHAATLS